MELAEAARVRNPSTAFSTREAKKVQVRFGISIDMEIIAKHEGRHVLQAEEVRRSPGFPT